MSAGIDIKLVEERYARMSSDELIRIATQDAQGLTPEAMEVVNVEINKRGLDTNISRGINAQNRTYTIDEVDALCDIVSRLNCPGCGSNTARLNGTLTAEVMSVVIFTTYNKKIKVGCASCLDKANNSALTSTLLIGWWGIPWGIVRTIQSISINRKSKKGNHSDQHNDYLRHFAISTIGELETYKDDKEKLQQIVARQNRL